MYFKTKKNKLVDSPFQKNPFDNSTILNDSKRKMKTLYECSINGPNLNNMLSRRLVNNKANKNERANIHDKKAAIVSQHISNSSAVQMMRTYNMNDICVSLKLKIEIVNDQFSTFSKNKKTDYNNGGPTVTTVYIDINPKGVMSRDQRKFHYHYIPSKRRNNMLHLEHLARRENMKKFSTESRMLAGKRMLHEQSSYVLMKLLQTAIYGCVYVAKSTEYINETVVKSQKAIKILSKDLIEITRHTVQEDPLSEYYFRDKMSGHSNVLSCDTIFDDEQYIYMVMPFAVHGDLFEVMKNREVPLSEEQGRYLFYQIILAIKFLHSKRVAMRDISLENVLLFENEKNGLVYPVLNDPGQALIFKVNEGGEVINEPFERMFGKVFRPPEILEQRNYDPTKVDVFCVGYILYFCLTRYELFRSASDKDMFWSMLKNKNYDDLLSSKNGTHLSCEVLDLIFHCLESDIKKRYTLDDMFNHSWFKGTMHPLTGSNLFSDNSPYYTQKHLQSFTLQLLQRERVKQNIFKVKDNSSIRFQIAEHAFVLPSNNLEESFYEHGPIWEHNVVKKKQRYLDESTKCFSVETKSGPSESITISTETRKTENETTNKNELTSCDEKGLETESATTDTVAKSTIKSEKGKNLMEREKENNNDKKKEKEKEQEQEKETTINLVEKKGMINDFRESILSAETYKMNQAHNLHILNNYSNNINNFLKSQTNNGTISSQKKTKTQEQTILAQLFHDEQQKSKTNQQDKKNAVTIINGNAEKEVKVSANITFSAQTESYSLKKNNKQSVIVISDSEDENVSSGSKHTESKLKQEKTQKKEGIHDKDREKENEKEKEKEIETERNKDRGKEKEKEKEKENILKPKEIILKENGTIMIEEKALQEEKYEELKKGKEIGKEDKNTIETKQDSSKKKHLTEEDENWELRTKKDKENIVKEKMDSVRKKGQLPEKKNEELREEKENNNDNDNDNEKDNEQDNGKYNIMEDKKNKSVKKEDMHQKEKEQLEEKHIHKQYQNEIIPSTVASTGKKGIDKTQPSVTELKSVKKSTTLPICQQLKQTKHELKNECDNKMYLSKPEKNKKTDIRRNISNLEACDMKGLSKDDGYNTFDLNTLNIPHTKNVSMEQTHKQKNDNVLTKTGKDIVPNHTIKVEGKEKKTETENGIGGENETGKMLKSLNHAQSEKIHKQTMSFTEKNISKNNKRKTISTFSFQENVIKCNKGKMSQTENITVLPNGEQIKQEKKEDIIYDEEKNKDQISKYNKTAATSKNGKNGKNEKRKSENWEQLQQQLQPPLYELNKKTLSLPHKNENEITEDKEKEKETQKEETEKEEMEKEETETERGKDKKKKKNSYKNKNQISKRHTVAHLAIADKNNKDMINPWDIKKHRGKKEEKVAENKIGNTTEKQLDKFFKKNSKKQVEIQAEILTKRQIETQTDKKTKKTGKGIYSYNLRNSTGSFLDSKKEIKDKKKEQPLIKWDTEKQIVKELGTQTKYFSVQKRNDKVETEKQLKEKGSLHPFNSNIIKKCITKVKKGKNVKKKISFGFVTEKKTDDTMKLLHNAESITYTFENEKTYLTDAVKRRLSAEVKRSLQEEMDRVLQLNTQHSSNTLSDEFSSDDIENCSLNEINDLLDKHICSADIYTNKCKKDTHSKTLINVGQNSLDVNKLTKEYRNAINETDSEKKEVEQNKMDKTEMDKKEIDKTEMDKMEMDKTEMLSNIVQTNSSKNVGILTSDFKKEGQQNNISKNDKNTDDIKNVEASKTEQSPNINNICAQENIVNNFQKIDFVKYSNSNITNKQNDTLNKIENLLTLVNNSETTESNKNSQTTTDTSLVHTTETSTSKIITNTKEETQNIFFKNINVNTFNIMNRKEKSGKKK